MENANWWDDNHVDVSAEVNFIWQVATLLHSVSYKDADHRDVILPMTVLRRLECALAPTKQKVVDYESAHPGTPDRKLERLAGLKFFNKSPWTLEKLLSVKTGQAQDLKDYIAGFSPNVKGIFAALKFELQIDEMARKDVLNGVIKRYAEIDLSPDKVDSIKMGYIFEDLMRKFYENAEAGKQYTGRDIIRLMVSILMSEGADDIFEPGKVLTFLDIACGTAGMLSSSYSYVKHCNPDAQVFLYGQEYDDAAHAIAIAEMLIKGQDPQNIRCVDSLRTDCFPDLKARFVIENPPFGTSWGGGDGELQKREDDVRAEHAKGERGRFPAGLPATGDSQLLFVQASVAKMDETCGRAAIIEHAGPLYSGDAGSGESEVRRWLLKKDLIEAIIALPVDMFYNTGLQTYIWILSKNKSRKRRGKVQLIDASSFCHPLRKKLGDKKNEITPADREAITKLYTDFKPGEFVKIFDNEDFLYREYTVMPPLQRRYEITNESMRNLIDGGYLSSIYNEKELHEVEARKAALKDGENLSHKDEIKLLKNQDGRRVFSALVNDLFDHCSEKVWYEPKSFTEFVAKIVDPYTRYDKLIAKIVKGLSTPDPMAEVQRDKHGEIIYDTDLKDTEIVPYKESIDDYMAREVLPHMPGAKAFFLEDLKAKKPVIKTGAKFKFTSFFYQYENLGVPHELFADLKANHHKIENDISTLKCSLEASVRNLVTKGAAGDVALKDSGVDWIGLIPADWSVKILGSFVRQVKCKNVGEHEKNLLSLSYGQIKRKDIAAAKGLLPENYGGYNIIEGDDIVLRLTDLQNDHTSIRVGQATERGIVTSAYVTIRPDKKINAGYLHYAILAYDLIKGFYGFGEGVRQGLTFDDVKRIKFPVPPLDEQRKIAELLDQKWALVDSLRDQLKCQIARLEALKRSMVYADAIGECPEQMFRKVPR